MMSESNMLYVIDEDGNELEMEIIFTFEDEANKRKYVIFSDPKDEDGEVFASAYNDEGNLLPVESEEEWAMIEEVLGAFNEDGSIEED